MQASDTRVASVIAKTTEWPAYAVPLTDGVATTSLSEQVPLGTASGVGVGLGLLADLARRLPWASPAASRPAWWPGRRGAGRGRADGPGARAAGAAAAEQPGQAEDEGERDHHEEQPSRPVHPGRERPPGAGHRGHGVTVTSCPPDRPGATPRDRRDRAAA